MPLFDANALAVYRELQADNMLSECDLIAFVPTRTASGSTSEAPAIVGTVPCRISALGASIPLIAEQPIAEAEYMITLPAITVTAGISRLNVRGVTADLAWEVQMIVTATPEPRTFAASRKLRAKLAGDIVSAAASILYPQLTLYPSTTIFPAA